MYSIVMHGRRGGGGGLRAPARFDLVRWRSSFLSIRSCFSFIFAV